MLGYDPILLEFIPVSQWLKDNDDNFVVLGDSAFEKEK